MPDRYNPSTYNDQSDRAERTDATRESSRLIASGCDGSSRVNCRQLGSMRFGARSGGLVRSSVGPFGGWRCCAPLLHLRSSFAFVSATEEPAEQSADDVCRRYLFEAATRLWLDEHNPILPRRGVAGVRDPSFVRSFTAGPTGSAASRGSP